MTLQDDSTIKRSSSPSGRDNKRRKGFISSDGHTVNSKELFVSNLHFETTWQEFKDTVKEIVGEEPFVKLFSNEQGKPRGCGIISFKSSDNAKIALEKMHDYEWKGRKMKVNESFDEPRDKHGYLLNSKGLRKKDMEARGDEERGWGNARAYSSSSVNQQFGKEETYGLNPQFLASIGIKDGLTNKIWVSNLDEDRVDERKLLEVFRLAGHVVVVILSRTKEGRSKGHAIIEYKHPLEAVQAITLLNNSLLYGKKMYVRLDRVGEKSNSRYTNRMPDGLEVFGKGLGMNGSIMDNISEQYAKGNFGMGSSVGSADSMNDVNKMAVLEALKKKKEEQAMLQTQLKAMEMIQKSSSPLPQMSMGNGTKEKNEEERLNEMGITKEQMVELLKMKTMNLQKEEMYKQQQNPSASFLWQASTIKDYEHKTGSSQDWSSNFNFMTPGMNWK